MDPYRRSAGPAIDGLRAAEERRFRECAKCWRCSTPVEQVAHDIVRASGAIQRHALLRLLDDLFGQEGMIWIDGQLLGGVALVAWAHHRAGKPTPDAFKLSRDDEFR